MGEKSERTCNRLQNSMWTYPWDVLDLGVENVVSEVTERAGVGGISLATVYHAGRFLQPRSPRRKVYFPEDGTVYFDITPSKYDSSLIKPQVSSEMSRGDALRALQEALHERRGRLSAWVVGLHNTRIGTAYPQVTVENAFGDRYVYAMCPNNPDACMYLRLLLEDMTSKYELDAVELESFNYMGYYHEFHHEKDGVGLTDRDQFLLSLCFCEHCREKANKAGIPIEHAARTVRGLLQESFERDLPEDCGDFVASGVEGFREHHALYEYLIWRTVAVTELCREIRQAVDARTEVYFLGLFTPATSWLFGVDFADVTNEVDGIVVCCYDSPAAQVGEDMRMSRMELQHKQEKRVLTGLRVFYPEVRNEEDFRHKVKAAVDAGTDGFVFYNYGLIPAGRLDWVRRSIMG